MNPIDDNDRRFVNNIVESATRIGLIFVLILGTYYIVQPFILPVLWGAIIAVALNPIVNTLSQLLKLRRSIASVLLVIICIAVMIVPFGMVSGSLYDALMNITHLASSGNFTSFTPNESIKTIPFIGERLFDGLIYVSTHGKELAMEHLPQIKQVLTTLLSTFGSGLTGVLMFVISLIIAGVFMVASQPIAKIVVTIFERSAGEHGSEWAEMTAKIIRSVLVGVIGVAFIQTAIISAAMFTFHIPAAGLFTIIILVLCIAQLPAILAIAPLIGYMYFTADTTSFLIFTIWGIVAGLSDNILKPLLMGRGISVPMPVIIIGSLGGMMYAGIIGLFLGAVVLALWWGVLTIWLGENNEESL
ncbi:AI-2E family transporter [Vibrio sp. S11_S32]|uniref:AI-2E family transporter n=1 Tax=Vibrio sp. S11_S32 TaxID=2720225 RepID=UPI0016801C51|nr:AI-2E family transporter [Vibrio sp. S11_S32]MBD1577461.1 AI-2E family transporter [Vibrio sp. S11_S32]